MRDEDDLELGETRRSPVQVRPAPPLGNFSLI